MIEDRKNKLTGQQTSMDNPIKGSSWLVVFLGKTEEKAKKKWHCLGGCRGAAAFCTLIKFVCQELNKKAPPRFYYDWTGENSSETIEDIITRLFRNNNHNIHKCRINNGKSRCTEHMQHNNIARVNRAVGHVAIVFDETDFYKHTDFTALTSSLKGKNIELQGNIIKSIYPICSMKYPTIPSNPKNLKCRNENHSCIVNLICMITNYDMEDVHKLLVEKIKECHHEFTLDEPLCLTDE
ncbi:MAG: hypothetical protein FWB88_01425 [Defluviitaleaceae bacterium]|nr:hypothetical protein [Defluviitaleaceae bacterium]MCL2238944.1 hypothetical protein [Defluviitaleaceae bacterium]